MNRYLITYKKNKPIVFLILLILPMIYNSTSAQVALEDFGGYPNDNISDSLAFIAAINSGKKILLNEGRYLIGKQSVNDLNIEGSSLASILTGELRFDKNCYINSITFENSKSYPVYSYSSTDVDSIIILNCNFQNNLGTYNVFVGYSEKVIKKIKLENISIYGGQSGIAINSVISNSGLFKNINIEKMVDNEGSGFGLFVGSNKAHGNNVIIDGVVVTDFTQVDKNASDCMGILAYSDNLEVKNCRVKNIYSANGSSEGIYIKSDYNFSIHDNYVENTGEGSNSIIQKVLNFIPYYGGSGTIYNNKIIDTLVANKDGIKTYSNHAEIYDNDIHVIGSGISLSGPGSESVKIFKNRIRSIGGPGIFTNVYDSVFIYQNNIMSDANNKPLLDFSSSKYVFISNNDSLISKKGTLFDTDEGTPAEIIISENKYIYSESNVDDDNYHTIDLAGNSNFSFNNNEMVVINNKKNRFIDFSGTQGNIQINNNYFIIEEYSNFSEEGDCIVYLSGLGNINISQNTIDFNNTENVFSFLSKSNVSGGAIIFEGNKFNLIGKGEIKYTVWSYYDLFTPLYVNSNLFCTVGLQMQATGDTLFGAYFVGNYVPEGKDLIGGGTLVNIKYEYDELKLNASAILSGAYLNDEMTTDLLTKELLPLKQPYSNRLFNYSCIDSVATIPPNIVDWILIELRRDLENTTIIAPGFIDKNGKIVDLDGKDYITFKDIQSGQYYVIIHHRNHLSIMSSEPVYLSENITTYDFTSSASKAYGNNSMLLLDNGKYGMFSGDGDKNGVINTLDYGVVANNILKVDYNNADYNLNGVVNILDYQKVFNCILNQTNVLSYR